MIPELGHYGLILALCLAIVQAILPLVGAAKGRIEWMQMARSCAYGQCCFIGVSFFCLAYAFLTNDFSVAYVAENSNRHLPVVYRFCALWGAHEGSLLLWVFILSLWMSAVSYFSRRLPLDMVARVLAILAMISIGFLLFLLMTSSPFERLFLETPVDGRDLNPLLQDPGLAIHPPMLYIGYVGFSVAFAFAIGALISGRMDATWARWSRPWTLVAWCFLTLGITLGSWWAYRVLGWGGWWFWDPVENASFLPWLTGTALIHSLVVAEKRNAFKAWTVLLAICAFSLSLIGTFLVRSGILISVHAFAVDPLRGAFILKFLVIVVGGSLLLYAWRGNQIREISHFEMMSRETMLLSNNVLLTVAMITVLLGTLYPLLIEAMGLGKLSVGAPYFNAVFIPLMTPLLFLMGVGPLFRWKQAQWAQLSKRLYMSFTLSLLLAIILPLIFVHHIKYTVILGLLLSFWIIIATLQDNFIVQKNRIRWKEFNQNRYGMMMAHIGVAVCVIGIVLSSTYSVQRDVRMSLQDQVNLGNYQFQFETIKKIKGSNYSGVEANINVKKNNQLLTIMHPQQRVYTVQNMAMTKTAINATIFRDLYVALGDALENNAWSFRIYYKPFVRWIWAGGLLMLLGGFIAALDRRYRLKLETKE